MNRISGKGWHRTARLCGTAIAAVLLAESAAGAVRAETQFGIYGGWGHSHDSDVDLFQPNGTDMHMDSVEWEDHSLSFDGGPPYYGIRAIYWKDSHPGWGVMLDFTHAKVQAELDKDVAVSGTRDGAGVSGREPLNRTVSLLEFTDGLNLLTLNLLYRLRRGDWTPYGGIGVGVAVPNVEFSRANSGLKTDEFQLTGVALQALAGVEKRLGERVSVFGEYKISYSDHDADIVGGGSLETEIVTNQLLFGLSYRFGRRGPAAYK